MTRETALDILQLPNDVGIDVVETQFRQLYNNYQVKITNAPTDKLRGTFTENLERLNEAYRTLKQPPQNSRPKFFPTTEPSTIVKLESTAPNPTINNGRPSLPFTDEEYRGVKKWRSIFLLTSILTLTLAGLFLAKWWESSDMLSKQEQLVTEYKDGLKNLPFEIKNSTDKTVHIRGFKIFYFDEEEKKVKELLHSYKDPQKLVSGDSYKPNIEEKALAYFIIFHISDDLPPNTSSGILNEDQPIAKLYLNSQ